MKELLEKSQKKRNPLPIRWKIPNKNTNHMFLGVYLLSREGKSQTGFSNSFLILDILSSTTWRSPFHNIETLENKDEIKSL